MRIRKLGALTLALMLLVGTCVPARAEYNMPYYIGVDLTNQIVTVYNTSDNTIARQMLCSSGMNDSTPEGVFYMPEKGRVAERSEWIYYGQYQSWVKFSTRIWHGYMFHSLPYARKDESTLIEESARQLGTPTSHGCMRLRLDDARFIALNCLQGTMVRMYKDEEKQEGLRELLSISSYTGEDGMSYTEFLGYSDDALGRGSGGSQVSDLQARLKDLGYYGGEVSGRYDTDTVAAVKHVQSDLGLAQTGITTGELAELLYSQEAPVSAGQVTLREGSSGPVVARLQAALARLGLYEGEQDSVYDVDVADAVRRFQGMCNYVVDGVATPMQQQALYYALDKLDGIFGEGATPTVEIEREEVQMARLHAEAKIIVRAKPNTKSNELGKLSDGDIMMLDGVEGEWARISKGKASGYVMKKYLEPFTQENLILHFSDGNGATLSFGHWMSEYRDGATSLADEFSAYYTGERYSGGASEMIRCATVSTGSDDVRLNLRAEASTDGEVLAEVPNGMKLRVLDETDGWTQVGYDERIGYLMSDYLEFWEGELGDLESTEVVEERSYTEEELEGGITAVVIGRGKDSVPVYESGSEDAKSLGRLPDGTQLEVVSLQDGDDWVKVRYRGHTGYMLDSNLQFQLM